MVLIVTFMGTSLVEARNSYGHPPAALVVIGGLPPCMLLDRLFEWVKMVGWDGRDPRKGEAPFD